MIQLQPDKLHPRIDRPAPFAVAPNLRQEALTEQFNKDMRALIDKLPTAPHMPFSNQPEYNLPNQGKKHDQGKIQWDLIPFATLEGMARVLMFGAAKYDKHQWRNGMPHTQPFEALLRHLFAWQAGEDLDDDSLLPHLDHALCELLFLRHFVQKFPSMDNRYGSAYTQQAAQ